MPASCWSPNSSGMVLRKTDAGWPLDMEQGNQRFHMLVVCLCRICPSLPEGKILQLCLLAKTAVFLAVGRAIPKRLIPDPC